MKLSELNKKNLCFLGLGIDNLSLIKFLVDRKIDCRITVADQRGKKELVMRYFQLKRYPISWRLGKNYDCRLNDFDLIIRSPGYPFWSKNLPRKKADTAIGLFLDNSPTDQVIGVTGTKGKGTTASLIYEILKAGGKTAFLGGNIGVPVFDFFSRVKKNDWVVLELSSFQLEGLRVSPKISVITNFFPEHLLPADSFNPNYHKNLVSYWQTKLNVAKLLDRKNVTVVNQNLKSKLKNIQLNARLVYFGKSDLSSRLMGEHNRENIAAASAVAGIIGINQKKIASAVKSFKGLEHRLEFAGKTKGVSFFNDSFATTEESAITALESFDQPVILLAGGADKGAKFKKLAREIKRKTKCVVLFKGQASLKINRELLKIKYPSKNIAFAASMPKAFKMAVSRSLAHDVILLSPAAASFGLFKNYKERGLLFKQEVKKLNEKKPKPKI